MLSGKPFPATPPSDRDRAPHLFDGITVARREPYLGKRGNMHQYGRFPSDVDTRPVTIQQRYPGCGCVLATTICHEELEDYTKQPDGTSIGLDPSGKCAGHLEMEGLHSQIEQLRSDHKRLRDLLYRLADYVSKHVRTNDHKLATIIADAVIASAEDPPDDVQAPRPYLGQRCHIEGRGFGTIVALKLDMWNGEQDVPVARVNCDDGSVPWMKLADVELLATYPAV